MNLLRALLFPPKCAACRRLLPLFSGDALFCPKCGETWETERRDRCGFCQKVVGECTCATELMQRSGCRALFKLAYYKTGADLPQNRLLFKMKRSSSKKIYSAVADLLAARIEKHLKEGRIDPRDAVLTYAPRSRRAASEQGVDQAGLLAKYLSKKLSIPCVRAISRARGKNRQQKELTPADRIKNAKESFRGIPGVDLSGKTVFLVDDTVTTGATMAVCTGHIKAAHARRVVGVSLTMDEVGRFPKEERLSTAPYF